MDKAINRSKFLTKYCFHVLETMIQNIDIDTVKYVFIIDHRIMTFKDRNNIQDRPKSKTTK